MVFELDLEEENVVQGLLNHESFFDPRYIESKFSRIIKDLDAFSEKLNTLKYLAKVYPNDDINFMMSLFNLINKNFYFWAEDFLIEMVLGKDYKEVTFLIDVPEPSDARGFYYRADICLSGYASRKGSINTGEMYPKEEMFEAIKKHQLIVDRFEDERNYRGISEREYNECRKQRAEFSYDCKSAYNIATNYPEIVKYIKSVLTKQKLNTFLKQYIKIYKNILKGSKVAAYQYMNSKNTTPNVEAKAQEICRKLTYLSEE